MKRSKHSIIFNQFKLKTNKCIFSPFIFLTAGRLFCLTFIWIFFGTKTVFVQNLYRKTLDRKLSIKKAKDLIFEKKKLIGLIKQTKPNQTLIFS